MESNKNVTVELTKQNQTHRQREQTCGCQGGGEGVGWIENLGLVETNYCIYNG